VPAVKLTDPQREMLATVLHMNPDERTAHLNAAADSTTAVKVRNALETKGMIEWSGRYWRITPDGRTEATRERKPAAPRKSSKSKAKDGAEQW
jgi:hypothetical protein